MDVNFTLSSGSPTMPKLNARENTRNRSNAKKRLRNRALKATLKAAPAPAAKAKSKAKATPAAK
jgi:hypothetical protein